MLGLWLDSGLGLGLGGVGAGVWSWWRRRGGGGRIKVVFGGTVSSHRQNTQHFFNYQDVDWGLLEYFEQIGENHG